MKNFEKLGATLLEDGIEIRTGIKGAFFVGNEYKIDTLDDLLHVVFQLSKIFNRYIEGGDMHDLKLQNRR